MKTDLKVGDKVRLMDPKTQPIKDSQGDLVRPSELVPRGTGYVVTEVTDKYVTCVHQDMDNCSDKTCHYGQNDLHLIEVVD